MDTILSQPGVCTGRGACPGVAAGRPAQVQVQASQRRAWGRGAFLPGAADGFAPFSGYRVFLSGFLFSFFFFFFKDQVCF